MTFTSSGRTPVGFRFQALGVLAVAVCSALSWVAWLGWDQQYQVDPVTGVGSGPYEAWQVIGCALSLLTLFVGALLAGVRPLPASAALVLAFTAAWTIQAARTDDTGLYGVGMILLLVGLSMATALVSVLTLALREVLIVRRRS
ncbi:MAG TPA: hypothetical protein VK453_23440 [Micromonosporaceae bacterium]|nr:hypothetical protein [Micromonosporaceae bacterium]